MTDELERKDKDELAGLMRQILRDNAKLRLELADNLRDMESRLGDLVGSAFPEDEDGTPDFGGHKRYHVALMQAQLERAKMYRAIAEKSLTALFWALCVFVGSAVWAYVMEHIKK